MNFYEDIAHRLYVWNTKIGDTNFANPIDFIEAKHLEAPYKGKVFYENIIKAMPNHFGAKMRNDFFKEIVQYCKNKIEGKQLVLANETKGYLIHHDDLQAIFKQANYCFLKDSLSNKPLIYRNEQNEIVAKVFLPLLAYIFNSEKIPYTDFDNSKSLFNGMPFLKHYIESYQRGKSDFEKDFKLSPDTLYRNPEAYVRNLHHNYFHAKIIGTVTRTENNGWSYWKSEIPLLINKGIIAEIGYYSAFIASVWELAEIHPKLFASFDKCEHSTPPQQTETKTNKLKAPVLGLFCSLINKIGVDKKEETESATVYCKRICIKYKLPYTDRVRQNYNVNETKKLMQEFNEKVLPLIDNETKSLIQKYLDSKKPPKQNLYA